VSKSQPSVDRRLALPVELQSKVGARPRLDLSRHLSGLDQIQAHVHLSRHGLVDGDQEFLELGRRCWRCNSLITEPSAMSNAANGLVMPLRW
jgi:hypothetical protein